MTILAFPLSAENGTQQVVNPPGGVDQATIIYMGFQSIPSAGTVLIEGQRPGAAAWTSIYQGSAIGTATMCDGGFGALRVTFSGLSGGAGPSINLVPATTVMLPSKLFTDGGFGPNARLRIDPGQTGFFTGRMFRTFYEFNIPAAGTLNLLFQSPINFILWGQQVEIDQGGIKVENITNPTTGGVFTQLPLIGRNRMTEAPQPLYVSQMQCGQGGTLTGGTVVDVLRLRTTPNQGNSHSSNIVNGQDDERGIPPGSYGVRISALAGVSEASLGTIHFTWEERP